MESLYFLIPCALIFIVIAVKVLFWAINNGQYDNLDTEANRILFEDAAAKSTNSSAKVSSLPNTAITEKKSTTASDNND